VAERSHLSIGEVLSLLRDDFPDVTISKIRFLESQGLVDPERTPSGYRKFYEHDVERLRWILRQQREHFLPLKVIRGRLSEEAGGPPADGPMTAEEAVEGQDEGAAAPPPPMATAAVAGERRTSLTGRTPSLFAGLHAAEGEPAESGGSPGASPTSPGEVPASPGGGAPSPGAASAAPGTGAASPGAEPSPAPAPRGAPAPPGARRQAPPAVPPEAEDPDTYTVEELASSGGCEAAVVHELKQYGLIAPHAVVAGVSYYDAGALAVVRAAVEFSRHGVEARHLRMWRNAADREADLYQQVVLPLLRQRNPQARRQALDTLAELCASGAALRAALVERAVREIR
jgi:DNA-binding transcriptional MerR regulator